jgi:N-formylglutamate deformylase
MLPREYAPRFALSAAELFHESDPWTREIFAMGEAVQGRIEAEVAKAVVDLNCEPNLFPPKHPHGTIKSHTSHGSVIWTEDGFPTQEEMERLVDRYHRPYHDTISRISSRGGVQLAIDCHSMFAYAPPNSIDPGTPRPLFRVSNLGNEQAEGPGITCPAHLVKSFAEILEKEFADLEPLEGSCRVAVNTGNVSSYTLKRHGKGRRPWIQFDINRCIYLDSPEDRTLVPDSDRERISTLRRRLYGVLCSISEELEKMP